jgi:enoyl-CoA hydratase/carnithine racemase
VSERGIVTVVIDHPPTNVLDGSLLEGLRSLLDQLESDPMVRVVIFRSADPDFFVMHGDVELLVDLHPPAMTVTEANPAAATLQRLSGAPFVSIGVLDGAARGGGCEMLCAMDMRFGTDRAVIGQPEVAMGILPGAGGIGGRGQARAQCRHGRSGGRPGDRKRRAGSPSGLGRAPRPDAAVSRRRRSDA